MSEKVKVINPQKFDVGVKLLSMPLGINIKAKSFALVTEEDVNYIASISDVFTRGLLKLEEEKTEMLQAVGVDPTNNIAYIPDEEIKKKLSGSAKKLEEWLDGITEEYALDRIYDIAKDMDLNLNKVKILQGRMPNKDFMNAD